MLGHRGSGHCPGEVLNVHGGQRVHREPPNLQGNERQGSPVSYPPLVSSLVRVRCGTGGQQRRAP